MEHCITQLAPSVVESILVKRIACIIMSNALTAEECIDAIRKEFGLACGFDAPSIEETDE